MACISNSAYVEAALGQADAIRKQAIVDTAIYAGLALWQRNSSASISNMQKEIANRQMRLAEALQEHAEKFWPYEKAMVDDAFGETKAEPQYAALATSWGAMADDTLRRARTDWLEEMRQRCIRPTRCEDARWNRAAQQARADIMSFADRQAEARAEALNTQRYGRMYAALNLGRNKVAAISSYQQIMGTMGGNAAQMLSGTINSGLEAFGYYRTRQRFDGWGQGTQETFARMPGIAQQQPNVVVTMPVEQLPAIVAQPLAQTDPCGPMPPAGAGDDAWRRWNDCKGFK